MAFRDLGLYGFLKRKKRDHPQVRYSLLNVFSMLVFSRIIDTGSTAAEYRNRKLFCENYRFPLHVVYEYMDLFYEWVAPIQKVLYQHAPKKIADPDDQLLLFDGSNFYIFSTMPDQDKTSENGEVTEKAFRTYGFSKENRYPNLKNI